MGAYMYPIVVNYERETVREECRKEIDGPLNVHTLSQLVGAGDFSVYESDEQFATGWIIHWTIARPETDEEMRARIASSEAYNIKRNALQTSHENRARVTESRHITLRNYPVNWQELPEYANWRNARGQLCGFVEMDEYLTSTVY